MCAEVRGCLRGLWGLAQYDGGNDFERGFGRGCMTAVRRIWRAHGYERPPCRHCWKPESEHVSTFCHWLPIEEDDVTSSYAPVEDW